MHWAQSAIPRALVTHALGLRGASAVAIFFAAFLVVAGPAVASAQQVTSISTGGNDWLRYLAWYSSPATSSGPSGKTWVGQRFVAPVGYNTLTDFRIMAQGPGGAQPNLGDPGLIFEALVYRWNPTTGGVSGNPLYTSTGRVIDYGSGPTAFTFLPDGGVGVTPGDVYLIALHGIWANGIGEIAWANPGGCTYAEYTGADGGTQLCGGTYGYGSDPNNAISDDAPGGQWACATESGNDCGNMWLLANFSGPGPEEAPTTVPEPGSLLLLGTGLIGLSVGARLRGKSR